jgi:ribosome maturation factor RimP
MEVKTSSTTYEGDLIAASQEAITLEWKAREPKPVGKGKTTVLKQQQIPFSDIIKAKVVLKF